MPKYRLFQHFFSLEQLYLAATHSLRILESRFVLHKGPAAGCTRAMAPTEPSESDGPKLAMKAFSLSMLSKNGANANTKRNGSPGTKSTGELNGSPSSKTSLGKRGRGGFSARDRSDDSDSEHDGAFRNRGTDRHGRSGRRDGFEEVSGLEHGRVVLKDDYGRERGKTDDLVIPKMQNKDWRAELRAKNGKNLLPPEVQAQRAAEVAKKSGSKTEGVDVVNSKDGEIQWGLTVRKSRAENGNQDAQETVTEDAAEAQDEKEESKPRTTDEEALSALLGERREKKGPDLVIPVASSTTSRMNEGDAYKRAIRDAPEASTLEDYERVPVEEFGAALLRGMGWKGEKKEGAKEVKRRQNLLGLGATELKGAEELGAWVQKSDTKRLNTGGSSKNGGYGGERRPKASEYARERDRRREEREDRGGGGYRRERERERGYRDSDRRR